LNVDVKSSKNENPAVSEAFRNGGILIAICSSSVKKIIRTLAVRQGRNEDKWSKVQPFNQHFVTVGSKWSFADHHFEQI